MSAVFRIWNSSGLLLVNTKSAFIKKRQGQHFSEKSSVLPLSDWSTRRFEKPCLVPARFDWLHSAAEEPPQPVPKILALVLAGPCNRPEIPRLKRRCGSTTLLPPSQFRSWDWNWGLFMVIATCAALTTVLGVMLMSWCPCDALDRDWRHHLTTGVDGAGSGVLLPGYKGRVICRGSVLQVLQLKELLGNGDITWTLDSAAESVQFFTQIQH